MEETNTMARADSAPVPVMHDEASAAPTNAATAHTAKSGGKSARKARHLAGPWGASFDGTGPDGNRVPGLS